MADVILELRREVSVLGVDESQDRVAVAHRVDEHAKREQVVHLLELEVLRHHLAVHAEQVL